MSFCPTNFYFKKCDLASFFINLLTGVIWLIDTDNLWHNEFKTILL